MRVCSITFNMYLKEKKILSVISKQKIGRELAKRGWIIAAVGRKKEESQLLILDFRKRKGDAGKAKKAEKTLIYSEERSLTPGTNNVQSQSVEFWES